MPFSRIDQTTFRAVLWVCTGIEGLFLLTRFILRFKIDPRWVTEDILVFVAWLASVGISGLYTFSYQPVTFTIPFSTDQGFTVPENIEALLLTNTHTHFTSSILLYIGLWSIKLSLVFLFREFGKINRLQRVIWWTVLVLSILSIAVVLGLFDYSCYSSRSLEELNAKCLDPHSVRYQLVNVEVAIALDISTDAAIILLSGNTLWRARVTGQRKLALIGISNLTIFIIIIAFIRLYVLESDWGSDGMDPIWMAFWDPIEILVAIIVASLASFWTLFNKWTKLQNKTLSRRNSLGYEPRDSSSMDVPIFLDTRGSTTNSTHTP
ncbi:hypothetical protein BJX99DRAFT_220885 [Aspergillus californicus]